MEEGREMLVSGVVSKGFVGVFFVVVFDFLGFSDGRCAIDLVSVSLSEVYVGMTVAEAMRAETREGGGGESFRRLGGGGLRVLRMASGFW